MCDRVAARPGTLPHSAMLPRLQGWQDPPDITRWALAMETTGHRRACDQLSSWYTHRFSPHLYYPLSISPGTTGDI